MSDADLVTVAMMEAFGRRLLERVGEFHPVPKLSMGTVVAPGGGDVTLTDDSPTRPDGRPPDAVYARAVGGYVHPNERVVVHHEPPAGALVLGHAADGGGWIGQNDPGGWTGILTNADGTLNFAGTEQSRWRRYGQLCVANAVIRSGTTGFNAGTAGLQYALQLPHPAILPAEGGDSNTLLGRAQLYGPGATLAEAWVTVSVDGTRGPLQVVAGNYVPVDPAHPWSWVSGTALGVSLVYEVAPGA